MHSLENGVRVGGQQRQNLPGKGAISVFTTSQSIGRCWHHKGIVSSAREYYYCQFLPKREKREGERLESLRHSEAESGEREASVGNFNSKRLGPGRLFSLENKSSPDIIKKLQLPETNRINVLYFLLRVLRNGRGGGGADSQGIKTRKLDFTRISELRFLCLIELAPL